MAKPLLLILEDKIYFIHNTMAQQLDEEDKENPVTLFRLAQFVLCADTGIVLKSRHSLEDVFTFYLSNV